METKICTKCKAVKNLSDFYRNKKESDGHRDWCKECTKVSNAEWKRNNKEKVKEEQRIWKEKHPDHYKKQNKRKAERLRERLASEGGDELRAKMNEAQKEYRKNNLDRHRLWGRLYYAKNREKILARERLRGKNKTERAKLVSKESTARWHREHPDAHIKTSRKQRFKRFGVDEAWYEKQLASQHGGCAICGRKAAKNTSERFAIDHDHSCCGPNKACDKCRRGLLCASCNFQLALVENKGFRYPPFDKYLKKYNKTKSVDILPLFAKPSGDAEVLRPEMVYVYDESVDMSLVGCSICGVPVLENQVSGKWGHYAAITRGNTPDHLLVCPLCVEMLRSNAQGKRIKAA